LPVNDRLVAQLVSLERRVARGGHDSIDHPRDRHDDLANAIAGCAAMLRQPSYDLRALADTDVDAPDPLAALLPRWGSSAQARRRELMQRYGQPPPLVARECIEADRAAKGGRA